MGQYIARRVILTVPVLVGILFITFALARLIPGDPCRAALGERATDEICDAFMERNGLNEPIPVQFGIYLRQIIIEREEAGAPLFTTDVLEQLIGFYGKSVQGAASNFIQESLAMFGEQQQKFQEQMARAVTGDPVTAFTKLTEQNLELWRRMQSEFLKATGMPVSGQPEPDNKKEPSE